MKRFTSLLITGLMLALTACQQSSNIQNIQTKQITLKHGDRDISVWVWEPSSTSSGSIIFSHGAASAPWKYEALIKPWAEAGYTVYAPLHVDSTDHPSTENYKGFASWSARLQDVTILSNHIGEQPYIAAGHSYGALTALTMAGASPMIPPDVKELPDSNRVKLALAFSPPGAIPTFVDKTAYSTVKAPVLIQTGDQDILPGSKSWEPHLLAYAASKRDDAHLLVMEGVDHYFGGAICNLERDTPKQINEVAIASQISIEMIKAYYEESPIALKQLSDRQSNDLPVKFVRNQ